MSRNPFLHFNEDDKYLVEQYQQRDELMRRAEFDRRWDPSTYGELPETDAEVSINEDTTGLFNYHIAKARREYLSELNRVGDEGVTQDHWNRFASPFINIDTGEMEFGIVSQNEASWQLTRAMHSTGFTNLNAGNLYIRGRMLAAPGLRERLGGAFVSEMQTPEATAAVNHFTASKYNITDLVEMVPGLGDEGVKTPIGGNWGIGRGTVEDWASEQPSLLRDENGELVPEDEIGDALLAQMEANSPELYVELALSGFDFNRLKEVKNTHQFMLQVTDHFQNTAMMQSLAYHKEVDEDSFWVSSWSFIRDSFIDDPDSTAEMAIGVGLWWTGVGPAIVIANKVRKGAAAKKKWDKLVKLAEATSIGLQKLRTTQRFLPSQLPGTVIEKLVPSVAGKFGSLAWKGKLSKAGLWIAANGIEGFVSGFGVSLLDQWHAEEHYDHEFSWGEAGVEGVLEAAISPAANLAMTGLFRGSNAAAGWTSNLALNLMFDPASSGELRNQLKLATRLNSARNQSQLSEIVDFAITEGEVKAALEQETGMSFTWDQINENPAFQKIMLDLHVSTQALGEINPDLTVPKLIQDWRASREKQRQDYEAAGDPLPELTPETAMVQLATIAHKRMKDLGIASETDAEFQTRVGKQHMRMTIERLYAEDVESGEFEGSFDEYVNWLTDGDNPNRLLKLVPNDIRGEVETRWESLDPSEQTPDNFRAAVNDALGAVYENRVLREETIRALQEETLNAIVSALETQMQKAKLNLDFKGARRVVVVAGDGSGQVTIDNPEWEGRDASDLITEQKEAAEEAGPEAEDSAARRLVIEALEKVNSESQTLTREQEDEKIMASAVGGKVAEPPSLTEAEALAKARDLLAEKAVEEGAPTEVDEALGIIADKEADVKKSEETVVEMTESELIEQLEETAETNEEKKTVEDLKEATDKRNTLQKEKQALLDQKRQLEERLEALQKRADEITTELEETDPDFKKKAENDKEIAKMQAEADALTLLMPSMLEAANDRKQSKKHREKAHEDWKAANKKLKDLGKRLKKARKQRAKLKKDLKNNKNPLIKELKNNLREQTNLRDESSNIDLVELIQNTEGFTGATQYRVATYVASQLEALAERKKLIEALLEETFETNETISREKLVDLLFMGKTGRDKALNALNKEWENKEEFTEEETAQIMKEWKGKQTTRILELKRFKRTIERTGEELVELNNEIIDSNAGTPIGELDPDSHAGRIVKSPEDAAKETREGRVKVVKHTRENEEHLLNEAFRNLTTIRQTLFGPEAQRPTVENTRVGTATEDIILAAFPPELRDIGLHVLFSEAIVNQDEGPFDETNKHLARYDIGVIQDDLAALIALSSETNTLVSREMLNEARARLKDPNNQTGRYDLYGALADIHADQEALTGEGGVFSQLYTAHGYTLELNRANRSFIGEHSSETAYVSRVREEVVKRLRTIASPHRINRLMEEFEITPAEKARIKKHLQENPSEELTESEAFYEEVLSLILDKFLAKYELNIADFGNGKLDWQPATEVGKGIAHTLVHQDEGTKRARAVDPNKLKDFDTDTRLTERNPVDMSLKPVTLVEGELNHAAPHRAQVLADLKRDFKTRARITHILNHTLTPEEVAEFMEWAADKEKEGLPLEELLGMTPLGMHLMPDITNRTPFDSPPNMAELRRRHVEAMLDMPAALFDFIHDSQTLAQGDKLFFKDVMELFEEQTEFLNDAGEPKKPSELTNAERQAIIDANPTVAVYHKEAAMSAGTPSAAVNLGGLAVVLGWEMTYPALEGTSWQALDRGLTFLEGNESTPVEVLFSTKTYFDKSFNGKHHFRAMMFDRDNPDTTKALLEIGEGLGLYQTDEYVKAARSTKESLEKILREGAIDPEKSGLGPEELKALQKFYDKMYAMDMTGADHVVGDRNKKEREFWKIGIMTRLYSAGEKSIGESLSGFLENPDNGFEGEFTKAEVTAFTKFLVSKGVIEGNIVLDMALELGTVDGVDLKKKVIELLQKPLADSGKDRWDAYQRSHNMTTEEELRIKRDGSAPVLDMRLKERIKFIAAATGESPAKVAKHFEERIQKAKQFLIERGATTANQLSREEYHDYLMILCYDEQAYRTMPLLRAMNTINRTGRGLREQSRIDQNKLGWRHATDQDLFMEEGSGGAMDYVWFHTFAVDLAGNRFHPAYDFGFKTHNTSWSRTYSQNQNDAAMWELKNNTFYAKYQERIKEGMDEATAREMAMQEIDTMIVRDFQLRLAGEQRPMFGDFEDKTDAEFWQAWHDRSDESAIEWEKGREKEAELDAEQRDWDDSIDPESDAAKQLSAMRKNQGLPSRVRFLQNEEHGRRFGGNVLEIDTSNAAGFAAFRAKIADVDFFDRGILELRKIKIQRDIEQQESYLERREQAFLKQGKKVHVEGQSVIPEAARGFAHIWDESEMPIIPWQDIDWTNELAMTDKVGHMRLASKLRSALPAFAQETGLTHLLEQGHVAHLFYVMRLHQVQNRHMENLGRRRPKIRAIIDRADQFTREELAQIENETHRIAYLDDVWGMFKQEQDALNYDWRYQELFPSKGLPTFVPGFENPQVYRTVFKSARNKIKRNLKKWKAEREANFTPEEKAEFERIQKKLGWQGEVGEIAQQRLDSFWNALIDHEASELAQEEARKEKHNTYRHVLGRYKERTNNVEAFTLPMVPVSHIILEEGEMMWDSERNKWVEGGIDFSDTSVLPLGVQGQDVYDIQNQVNADENVREAIDKKVEEGHQLIQKFTEENGRVPTYDDFHTVEDQVAFMFAEMDKTEDSPLSRRAWQIRDRAASEWVYNKAYELGTFRNIGNFYLYVYADDKGGYNGLIGSPKRAAKAQRENIHEMKRGATVGTHSRVKGSTWRYRLTPEAILMALNSLNNHKALRYQEEANLLNIKRNEHTSHADNLANRPFFNQRNNERILTDVLEEMQAEAGGKPLETVEHGFQGYRGQRHRVVKASSYIFPTLAQQEAQGTNHAYVTASLVPLLQRLQALRHRGETEIVDRLETLIKEDPETAVVLGLILRMESVRGRNKFMVENRRLPEDRESWRDFSITPETIEVFQPLHDPEASMNKAYDMIREMNVILDARNFNNPMYYPVREALEASMRLETRETRVASRKQFDSDSESIYDKVDTESAAEELGVEESKVRSMVDRAVIQMTRVDSEDDLGMDDPFEYAHSVEPIEFSSHEGFTENLKGMEGPASDFNYDYQINLLATQIQNLNLSSKQKDILRVVLAQAIMKNPEIVRNLSLVESKLQKNKLGAALHKSGEYIIKFDTDQIGESTPDIIDVITHELAHIGVMKFIKEGGREWAEASAMLGTERGKQMMWDLVKAFHGGTMTAKAESLYNNYIDNPEEFMVQYAAYRMQTGDLYSTGVLAEIETKYSGEKSFLDKVFDKIGGFYSKLLHDVRQVFHRYKDTEPNLHSRMESLADSIMGLNMDKGQLAYAPSTDLERNVTYVHEGATRAVHRDPTKVMFPVTRIDRPEASYIKVIGDLKRQKDLVTKYEDERGSLSGKELDGTITTEERSRLEQLNAGLPRLNRSILEKQNALKSADYGKDAVGMSREDFVTKWLEWEERGVLREVTNEEDGTVSIKIDKTKLTESGDEQMMMSYVLRSASHKFGDKISENLAGILRHIGARGRFNGFIDGAQKILVGPSEAAATWLNPDSWGLLLSLMLEDNLVANTGAISNRLGIKTIGQVRREMDMFEQVIQREVADLMYKYTNLSDRTKTYWDPSKPIPKWESIKQAAREVVLGISDEGSLALKDFTPEEISDIKKLANAYTGIVDIMLDRGEAVGKITSDPKRKTELRVPLKLEKSVNVTEEAASAMMSELETVIADKSQLTDTHSNINHVTLFAQPWMPNYFLDEGDFDTSWREASTVNQGMMTEVLDLMAMRLYAQDTLKGPIDTGTERFKTIVRNWRDGGISPHVIRDYRKRIISDVVNGARVEHASIESLFGEFLTDGQKEIMRRMYNHSLKGRGAHADMTAKRLRWLKENNSKRQKLEDTYSKTQPFSEEIHTEGAHDRANPVDTPAQWHAGVLYQKSNSSAYFPHRTDTHMPTAKEIYENETLREFFTWDFVELVEGTIRGIGTDATERLALNDLTGDSGMSFPELLDMMENLQNTGLFNQHGEETSRTQQQPISKALSRVGIQGKSSDVITVLRRKRNVLLGLGSRYGENASQDPASNVLSSKGHDIIRFIYGSNLGTAITTVEGTLTALGGIFNMGDIRSAWRHPLILMKSLSKRKRIEMATELAYTLQYTLRDAQASDAFLYDVAVSEAGNKKLYKRKWHEIQRGHKETAKAADMAMRSAAALQGRRYLMKQLRKGTLAKAVKALDTHDALSRQEGIDDGLSGQDLENFVQSKRPQTQQQWVSILRKSGVPSTSFRHNWRVMLEMQQAGLMNKEYMGEVNEEGDVVPGLLEEALNRTDGWNGVYSIGDLARLAVGQEGLSKSDRDKQIKMINALREYDRRFIKRYAIDPNPMDTSTDGAPWTQIINMYKSFPTAFTAQRMFRDASNMSMHGFALKHGSHVLLDVAYMMLIQMAAGKDWEEIEEEFEEDFIGTAMQYLARFPGLGPYGGWIAQVLVSALKAAMGDQTRWKNYVPISVAAGLKTMETFLGAINWKDNQEAAEGIVAMLRFIPFFGEAIFRAALQTTVNGLYGDPMGTGASNKFDQNVLQTQTGPRPATGQEPMVSDPEVIKRSRENHLLNKYNVTESDLKDLPMSNERGGN